MRSVLPPLPRISTIMRLHGLQARQQLGQNFLFDLAITDRIVAEARCSGCTVIEIGSGLGSLTRSVLQAGCDHVAAVERDRRLFPILTDLAQAAAGRMTLVRADALLVDEAALLAAQGVQPEPWSAAAAPAVRLLGNLPFNISTRLLLKWLALAAAPEGQRGMFNYGRFPLFLMLQKEVTERVTAKPNSRAYCRLSVVLQNWFEVHAGVLVPADCFFPPPKVSGQMVVLRPRAAPVVDGVDSQSFGDFLAVIFSQRRKMLRRSLRQLLAVPDVEQLLSSVCIDPDLRPENLSVTQACALFKAVRQICAIPKCVDDAQSDATPGCQDT